MAHEQVTLPMPRHCAIGDLRWSFIDADQVLNGPRREPHLARPTKPMAAAQIADQFPLERATGQHIEIRVDGLRRDPHRRVVRIPLPQPARNLFGGPALREQREDRGAQAGVDGECPGLPRMVAPALGPLVGGHRPIGHGRGPVTSELTRQGTRGSTQRLGSGSEAMTSRQHTTQFFTFYETQSLIVGHVQLLGSWIDQDTGVALEP